MASSAIGSSSLPDAALHSAPAITSDVLVRLERDGTARYGSAALAVDDAKAEGETMLLYFHAFAFGGSGNLDALHTRLMNLPLMQAVPLVRDAAMLIFCNNPKRDTTDLVSRLRRYVQPRRWLLHSPDNAGYECGEFASLAASSQVWSRYAWVMHTHPDVVVTPEFYLRLSVRLPRLESNVGFIGDSYQSTAHIGYNMEAWVFRPRLMLRPNNSPAAVDQPPHSIFKTAAESCIGHSTGSSVRKMWPEVLLRQTMQKNRVRVDEAPLGAAHIPLKDENNLNGLQRGATPLFPGGTWHAHDQRAYASYVDLVESGANVHMNRSLFKSYLRAVGGSMTDVVIMETVKASVRHRGFLSRAEKDAIINNITEALHSQALRYQAKAEKIPRHDGHDAVTHRQARAAG